MVDFVLPVRDGCFYLSIIIHDVPDVRWCWCNTISVGLGLFLFSIAVHVKLNRSKCGLSLQTEDVGVLLHNLSLSPLDHAKREQREISNGSRPFNRSWWEQE